MQSPSKPRALCDCTDGMPIKLAMPEAHTMSPGPRCHSLLALGSTKSHLILCLHLHSNIREEKTCLDSHKEPTETLRPAVPTACQGMPTTSTLVGLDVDRLRSGPKQLLRKELACRWFVKEVMPEDTCKETGKWNS